MLLREKKTENNIVLLCYVSFIIIIVIIASIAGAFSFGNCIAWCIFTSFIQALINQRK